MRNWLPLVLLLAFPMAALTGCNGKPVEYARSGEPHCPNPSCQSALPERVIKCPRCSTRLRWVEGSRTCWHCDGAKTCRVCDGSGQEPGAEGDCYFCGGHGECQVCDEFGMVEYGGS